MIRVMVEKESESSSSEISLLCDKCGIVVINFKSDSGIKFSGRKPYKTLCEGC